MLVTALLMVLMGMMIAQTRTMLDRSSGLVAARYLAGRMALARTQAVARSATISLRFEDGPGGISIGAFQDGNRNGVLTRDIAEQIDRPISPPARLSEEFPGVAIALAPGTPGSDAVQLGATNLLSFTPAGTATSGTIYIRGRDGTQWAVRVLGATARTRVLRYDPATATWADPL
jgi:hypothetical protein